MDAGCSSSSGVAGTRTGEGRWACYVPTFVAAMPPTGSQTSTAVAQVDRRALLERIVEEARSFVCNAAGGDVVSLVQRHGVAEGVEAYVAYADRPYDVAGGDTDDADGAVDDGDCRKSLADLEADVKEVMFEVLRVLFVERVGAWGPSSAYQSISSLVGLAGVMDVASLYYYGREEVVRELVDGMVRLGMRRGRYAGWVSAVAENVSEVVMRVLDAAVGSRVDGLGSSSVLQDVRDGVAYLRDACLTLSCVLAASGLLREMVVETGCLDRLLNALDDVHDELVPKLYFYVGGVEEEGRRGAGDGDRSLRRQCCELECAAGCAASWLLDGLLTVAVDEGEARGSSSRGTSGASIRRGEMLLQALCLLKGRDGIDREAGPGLGNALASRYGLGGRIRRAIGDGRLSIDDAQKEYMLALLGLDGFDESEQGGAEESSIRVDAVDLGELGGAMAALIGTKMPLIQQVEEVLPGMYGTGFLAACLDKLDDSSERVIDALLVGSIPAGLKAMDQQLDLPGYLERKKEEMKQVDAFPELVKTKGKGRSAMPKKKKADAVTSMFLDTVETSYKDRLRNSIIAAQMEEQEYDDEYDDTYDDAVVKVPAGAQDGDDDIGAGAPNGTRSGGHGGPNRSDAIPSASGKHSTSGKSKPPKLWVLDGRIYNYAKPGARAVSTREEADALIAEQELSKLEIHGLGPQGNKHVEVLAGGGGSGDRSKQRNPKSRAGFKEKNKAAIGNHHRKDRAAKKQERAGGP